MSNIKDNKTFYKYFSDRKNSENIEVIHSLWKEHLNAFPDRSYYSHDYSFTQGLMLFISDKILTYDKKKSLFDNQNKLELSTDIGLDLYNLFYKKRNIIYSEHYHLLIALEASNQYELIKKNKINIYDSDYINIKFMKSLERSFSTKYNTNDIFEADSSPLTYERLTKIRNKYSFKSDVWVKLLHNPNVFSAYVQDGNKVSNQQIKKAFFTIFTAKNLSKKDKLLFNHDSLNDFIYGFIHTNQFKSTILPQKNYIVALNKFFKDEIDKLEETPRGQSGALLFWGDVKNNFFYHPMFKYNKLDGKMKENLYLENFGTKFVSKEKEKSIELKIDEIPVKKKIKI